MDKDKTKFGSFSPRDLITENTDDNHAQGDASTHIASSEMDTPSTIKQNNKTNLYSKYGANNYTELNNRLSSRHTPSTPLTSEGDTPYNDHTKSNAYTQSEEILIQPEDNKEEIKKQTSNFSSFFSFQKQNVEDDGYSENNANFDKSTHSLATYRQFRFKKFEDKEPVNIEDDNTQIDYSLENKSFPSKLITIISIVSVFVSIGIFIVFFDKDVVQLTKVMVEDLAYSENINAQTDISQDEDLLLDKIIDKPSDSFASKDVLKGNMKNNNTEQSTDLSTNAKLANSNISEDTVLNAAYVSQTDTPNPLNLKPEYLIIANTLLTEKFSNTVTDDLNIKNTTNDINSKITTNAQNIPQNISINNDIQLRETVKNALPKKDLQNFSSIIPNIINTEYQKNNITVVSNTSVEESTKKEINQQSLNVIDSKKIKLPQKKPINLANLIEANIKDLTSNNVAISAEKKTPTSQNAYTIQFAAFRTSNEAKRQIVKLEKSDNELNDYIYAVRRKEINNKGIYYSVVMENVSDKKTADQICNSFKQQKISDCFVRRN